MNTLISGNFGELFLTKEGRVLKKAKPRLEFYLVNEIILLDSISHPNIIKILEYNIEEAWLSCEYIEGCDLFEFIKKNHEETSDSYLYLIRNVISDIIDALCYLHDLCIFHMDIKVENVLVSTSGRGTLIDFGFAMNCEKGIYKCQYPIGTKNCNPPELCKRQRYLPEKVDVWALGVLIGEAVGKTQLFDYAGMKCPSYALYIKEGIAVLSKQKGIPFEYQHFLKLTLQPNDIKRPTMIEIRHLFKETEIIDLTKDDVGTDDICAT